MQNTWSEPTCVNGDCSWSYPRNSLVAERGVISRATLARLEHGVGARLGSVLAVARALGIEDQILAGFDPLRTDLGQARVRQLGRWEPITAGIVTGPHVEGGNEQFELPAKPPGAGRRGPGDGHP